jgi:hypothetical protein
VYSGIGGQTRAAWCVLGQTAHPIDEAYEGTSNSIVTEQVG